MRPYQYYYNYRVQKHPDDLFFFFFRAPRKLYSEKKNNNKIQTQKHS